MNATQFGQALDAMLTSLHARVAVLESKAVTDATAVWTWIKTNVVHLVTAASTGYLALHSLGRL